MNYSSIILASVFALAATAQAADDNNSTGDEVSDIQVECITTAVADDLDDSQMDAFVDQCVNSELAARQKPKNSQG